MLGSWRASTGVRSVGVCSYRDFPRHVYERAGPFGPERLYIDPDSHMPVKVERTEPHFLWGQQHVEYLYSNWMDVGHALFAVHAFRQTDGDVEITRSIGRMRLVAGDSAPSFRTPPAPPPKFDRFLESMAEQPDTVRAGPGVFLLRTRQYTHVVTLQRDTIYLLDATTGERRAKADSAWIGKLFPGRHPIVVVVTDLAWPHIGGLRFWVASGATIVSHRSSLPFIQRIVERRWTLQPDRLETRRSAVRLKFRAVDDQLALGGSTLQLFRIGGVGSENALMAYLPARRILWVSDYVQNVQRTAPYSREVWRRVNQLQLHPEFVAAQHIPLTRWSVVDSLSRPWQ